MYGYLWGVNKIQQNPKKFKISKIGWIFTKMAAPWRWFQESTIGGMQLMLSRFVK